MQECENLPLTTNHFGPVCSQFESAELPFWQQLPTLALSSPKGSLFLWDSRTAHQNLLPGESLGTSIAALLSGPTPQPPVSLCQKLKACWLFCCTYPKPA